MIQLLFIGILAFLGVLGGRVLAKVAKEEIKPGEKYLRSLQDFLLLALGAVLFSVVFEGGGWVLPLLAGGVLSYFLKKRYLYLGFTLVVASTLSSGFFLLVAALVFLYGLPYGAFQKSLHQDVFLYVVPFLLLLFPTLLVSHASALLAFAAGTQLVYR